MPHPAPLMVGDRKAAGLFDLTPAEFRRLVEEHKLPEGKELEPGMVRWSYDELKRIANGEKARPDQGIEL